MATDTNTAEGQAKAQLESIRAMVERLEHARECDDVGEGCPLSNIEFGCKSPDFYDLSMEEYHDEDAASQALDEDPLSVLVRSDWYTPYADAKAREYEILLCPMLAVRAFDRILYSTPPVFLTLRAIVFKHESLYPVHLFRGSGLHARVASYKCTLPRRSRRCQNLIFPPGRLSFWRQLQLLHP